MPRRSSSRSLDAKLEQLKRVRESPRSEEAQRDLRRMLEDKSWLVVSEAAKVVAEHTLEGCRDLLVGVWPRFANNGPKVDPGCRAKESALTALDCLEVLDPEPFLTAVRYRQLEPAMGGSVDTAGGVRVRSLLALLRMVHADAALLAGELMADSDPQVRAGVARGLGHYADRSLAALLAYKLHSGDEDAVVLAECATSLLAVAGPYGVDRVASLLSGDEEILKETAALALGQSRDGAALARLLAWVEQSAFDRDFRLGIRALGLSRHESARHYPLELVAEGSQARAQAAVEALAVHAYDESLRARVQQAANMNPRARLVEVVRRLFGAATE